MKTYSVLYHANCVDGYISMVYAMNFLRRQEGPQGRETIAQKEVRHKKDYSHDTDFINAYVKGRDVYMIDITIRPENGLFRFIAESNKFHLLDHHSGVLAYNHSQFITDYYFTHRFEEFEKEFNNRNIDNIFGMTAVEAARAIDQKFELTFDTERSGCGLSYNHFFPGEELPSIVKFVQDRDLNRFEFPETKNFMANFSSFPFNIRWVNCLEQAFKENPDYLLRFINEGRHIRRAQACQIERIVRTPLNEVCIDGVKGLMLNLPPSDVMSEALGQIAVVTNFVIGWCYSPSNGQAKMSIRSDPVKDFDCSALASKHFNGGGLVHAAGGFADMADVFKLHTGKILFWNDLFQENLAVEDD